MKTQETAPSEYKTLTANTVEQLDKLVTEALSKGYRLHGSPYLLGVVGAFPIYHQAVVGSGVEST